MPNYFFCRNEPFCSIYLTNAQAHALYWVCDVSEIFDLTRIALEQIFSKSVMVLTLYPEKHTLLPFLFHTSPQKPMGMLINALAPDCSIKDAVAPATAVHVKKDYTPAKSRFVAMSKDEVEANRRKAYAYAF